jgi:nucleotide-binding universal stress UspA family protein
MYKKILVPLDGSDLSEKILPQVAGLARTHDAQITLMTAGHFTDAPGYIGQDTIKEVEARERESSEKYLETKANQLQDNELSVNWIYKPGRAAWEIVATANEENVDLIAMSTHGGGEVAWSLGNVAEKVANHSPVPVLLLPVMEYKPPSLKAEWFMGA